MSRAILILGGGLMQLPVIAAARALGLFVHVTDGNPDCLGRERSDQFHPVDLRDIDRLKALAMSIDQLAAVFTAGTDFSYSVASVAAAAGVPGVRPDAALNATDKGRMRERLGHAGVPVPSFRIVGPDDPAPAIGSTSWVVKPADSMGARAVRLVETQRELSAAVDHARSVSPTGQAVVEQYIEGEEFSIDALFLERGLTATGIARRHIYFSPFFVELGHTIPSGRDESATELIAAALRDSAGALGLDHGAAKGDIFLSPDGAAVVGEVAARLSGGFMSGWTYPLSTGVDLTRCAIRLALGEQPSDAQLHPRWNRVVAERALISAPGRVASVDHGRAAGHCDHLFVHVGAGDVVAPPTNNVEKVANAIAAAASADEAETAALMALDELAIDLVPDIGQTSDYLFETGWYGRYRFYTVPPDVRRALERAPRWRVDTVPREYVEIPRSIGGIDMFRAGIRPAVPVLAIEALIARSVARGEARVVEQETPSGPLVWRALLAAGRQGLRFARYLRV